jgi:hypothetical protein
VQALILGAVRQIDDLFLATEEPFVTTNSYRMTPADSQALATFAANVPSIPSGSSFRVGTFKTLSTHKGVHSDVSFTRRMGLV